MIPQTREKRKYFTKSVDISLAELSPRRKNQKRIGSFDVVCHDRRLTDLFWDLTKLRSTLIYLPCDNSTNALLVPINISTAKLNPPQGFMSMK